MKFEKFFKQKPSLKIKLKKYTNNSGRNNTGQITILHKGSGRKKRYRQINFVLDQNFLGIIFSIEYDPNRNSNIASIFNFKTNFFFYIIAAKGLYVGNIVKSGFYSQNKNGHTMVLRRLPIGCCVYNITSNISNFARFSRAAGVYAKIIAKNQNFAILLLNSGIKKFFFLNCFATLGIVSENLFVSKHVKKAGRSRWLNIRPTVRGVAKNAVDHPNGGGEGKKSGKRKNPWGKVLNSPK